MTPLPIGQSRRRFLLIGLALTMGVGVAAWPAQDITFRATTDTITVDVSVIEDGRPVTDLTVDDFVLTDSGRPQRITSLSRETLPIDVTCIIDLSASVQGPLLDALTRAVDAIGSGLGPSDRARVVSFNQQIRQVRPLEPGWPADLSLGTPGSLTSLFDAVTVALIAPAEIGRRRMAIVFTDGLDTTSFLDGSQLLEIARRSNMAVFTVALADGTASRPHPSGHETLFAELAATTGGMLDVVQQDEDLSAAFAQAFEAFRTSYVVAYTYDGPPTEGWHPIDVTLQRPGSFDIRARQGYFSEGR